MTAATLEMKGRPNAFREWVCPVASCSAASVPNKEQTEFSDVFAKEGTPRLAVPRRGHVLSTVAETYGQPIREAVAILTGSLTRKHCSSVYRSLFAPGRWQPVPDMVRPDAEMTAWAIASMWVTGVASEALPAATSLAEAEQWFFGPDAPERLTSLPSAQAISRAEKALRDQADPSAYYELLPYVLDPHGPGSRLSVRRNPDTRAARARKRADGVFYTPADVAEYMAGNCLGSVNGDEPTSVFDPACGTGVFLRAALKELQRRHPQKSAFTLASGCLFGTDIDPWPLNATTFVLLADIWIDRPAEPTAPAVLWHRLRLNYACIDTLRIDPAEVTLPAHDRSDCVGDSAPVEPADQFTVSDKEPDEAARISISRLFPALGRGPRVILGNPPYADLGHRADIAPLGRTFETLAVKPQPGAEIYLLFIEQMTRLADKTACAGALVLPLSIACNIGPQFTAARKLIAETHGRWRFAFFDREPHALFGEDVKTRNAIILWSRESTDRRTVLATGPLRKWRGDSRAAMFSSLRFTVVEGDIRAGIPKIEGDCQAAALKALSTRWTRLEQAVQGIARLNLARTPDADDRTVFVGPTAYNFLNVFLKPPRGLLASGQTPSEHPLYAVRCASRDDALAVFAMLTSHLSYWWWHTHGDGFHVSRRFIANFPLGLETLAGREAGKLSACGAELWSVIKTNPIISLNRGRISLAYTPNGHDDIRRKADQVLADLAGLEWDFVNELQQFTAHTVAATLREHAITTTSEKEGA